MDEEKARNLMSIFNSLSGPLAFKLGIPEQRDDLYSEMCCSFALSYDELSKKPLPYVIEVCKNRAINKVFRGKSVCSKPRKNLIIVSIDHCYNLTTYKRDIARSVYQKKFIKKLFAKLTRRERQVAELLMDEYTEKEIAEQLHVTQQRVNFLKKKIRKKAQKIIKPDN